MKKISLFLFTMAICLFSACHNGIWDAIDDLDVRVTKLEELCKEMNTNIVSIQTIINVQQSGDYITGIVEVKKDGKVIGYTITFANHEAITIYHGEDGKDGQNGNAPIVGVAQDTDGVYYWTLNGQWLMDANGNKMPVSGTNGKDGAMPKLKIEDGYWYVSYDDGTTWEQLGKAVGENGQDGTKGDKGDKGEDGDSMFQSVTQDENYVYFTLADGTVIKIAKSGDGTEEQPNENDIIEFEDVNVLAALLDAGVDINNDGYISYGEAASVDTVNFSNNTSIAFFREFKYFTNTTVCSFENCSNLRYVTLPDKLIKILDNGFTSCQKLSTIKIPESCKQIGISTFCYCVNLKEVVLPQGLKRIEANTFTHCSSLKHLDIPNSVNYIAINALKGLTIDTLILPESYSADMLGDLDNDNLTTIVWNSISYPTEYKLESSYGLGFYHYTSNSYMSNTTIRTIVFGDKVESLPAYLCYQMKGLTIYSKNIVPPVLHSNTFYNSTISKIYVPTESVEEYKSQWNKYVDKIIGYDF